MLILRFAATQLTAVRAGSGGGAGTWTPAATTLNGGAFTPDFLLWLDASDSNNVTLTGSDVDQWDDLSGNGNHFTQSTSGNKPDYDAVTNTIDGKAVISFDGTDDFLVKTSLSGWPADSSTAVSCVMVTRIRDASVDRAWWDISTSTLTNETGQFYHTGGASPQGVVRIQGVTGNAAVTALGSAADDTVILWSNTLKNNKREIFKNGTADGSETTALSALAYTNMRIGRLFQDVFPFMGDWAEVVWFSGDDDQTREVCEGYLAWKWGLEGDLPGGHTYKSGGPNA